MADLIAAFGTSHAFTLERPSAWDAFRRSNQEHFRKRFGRYPPDNARALEEVRETNPARYERIHTALDEIRQALRDDPPGALVILADDQNENLTRANLPQVAVYTGGDFLTCKDPVDERRAAPELAQAILSHAVAFDVDMAELNSFADRLLFAHAYGPVLRRIDPTGAIPVVPLFINEIHVPAPSPSRCYRIGEVVGEAIRAFSGIETVALIASGGFSHFTAGFPWEHYRGTHAYGSIDEPFDRWVVDQMQAGKGHQLAALTSEDLLDAGAVELRAWIAMFGAIGPAKPVDLVYEPFYQGLMGMGVARWQLFPSSGSRASAKPAVSSASSSR